LAPSLTEEWVTIQFGSLEPVVFPVMVPTKAVEVEPTLNTFSDHDEGWTLVTRRRPKKQRHTQPPPLRRRKGQSRKKTLDALRGGKDLTLTGSMKFNLLICWNENLFFLSH